MKHCPQDKILNPKTNRCVKTNGTLGRFIQKQDALLKKTTEDKLFFFSKSAKVAAGKGTNEIVHDASLYEPLGTEFRQVLSNFHESPFKCSGYTYNTIEHVFQAQKIAMVSKDEAYKFTRESKHEIGLGDGALAQKNRKLVFLSKKDLTAWAAIKDDVMTQAAIAKFKTCPHAATILKATLGAQLWHIQNRKKAIRFTHLETIRQQL